MRSAVKPYRHRVGDTHCRYSRRQRLSSVDRQNRCHEYDEDSENFEAEADPSRGNHGAVLAPVVGVNLVARNPGEAFLVAVTTDRAAAGERFGKVNENRGPRR